MDRAVVTEVARTAGLWLWAHKKKVAVLALGGGLMYYKGLSASDAATKALEILSALAGL